MTNEGEKYSYSLTAMVADNEKPYGLYQGALACVEAKQMTDDFVLETTEAKIDGKPGDYVVKMDGFVFVMPGPVFEELCEPVEGE